MSSVGKISGKFYEGGTNWTLTAASYTGYDPDVTNYTATVTAKYSWKAKSGKKTVTKSVTRTFALAVSPDPEFPVRGVVRMEEVRLAEDGSPHHDEGATEIEARQNLWGSTCKTIGAKVFYTSKKAKYKVFKDTVDVDGKSCALSVKVTTAGKITAKIGGVTLSGAGFDSESNCVYAVTLKKTQKITKGALKGGTNVWVAELMIDTTAGWDACQITGDYCTYNTKMPSMTAPVWIAAQRNPFALAEAKAVAAAVVASGRNGARKFVVSKTHGEDFDYALECAECMAGGKASLTAKAKANGTVALAGTIAKTKVSASAVLEVSPEVEDTYEDYDNPIEVPVRVRTATARFFSGNFVIEIVYAIESDEDGTYVNAAGKVWKK